MNYKILRKICRSVKHQTIYSRTKEIGSLKLFENTNDLSKTQIIFLQWLEIYHSLYMDLAMEKIYISEDVINDDLRTEAYLLWRRKHKKEDNKNSSEGNKLANKMGIPSMIFKRGTKK